LDIAGPEQEVGWMELKRILDHSMRDGKFQVKETKDKNLLKIHTQKSKS
jgi:hypothetical protein